ncbi:MAG: hypothetical protein COB36_01745 [Alphaproteobacteria bacterium]|nr:MAG: hypothetical protein COB36_01745 [Alphaproteobacteria bacterium]
MTTHDINEQFRKKGTSSPKNKIGLAHFLIDESLLDMAQDYGAYIEATPNKSQSYSMTFFNGNGEQNFTGNLSELRTHLRALHQPINASIEKAVKESSGYNTVSAGRKIMARDTLNTQIQNERKDTLALFRVMTTNSATLPEFVDPNDDVEHQHGPEHEIRTADMWRHTCEIDVKDRARHYDPDRDPTALEPAIIKNSRFHPSKGFQFELSPKFIDQNTEKDINVTVWDMISTVKGYDARSKGNTLHFTLEEMDDFCALTHNNLQTPEFMALLEDTRHQERVEDAIERIETEVQDINSPIYKAIIKDAAIPEDKKSTLRNLIIASSAITPILESDAMKARWAHYYFMQRKDPAMADIVAEVNVLNDVVSHYSAAEHVTQAHMEAIALDPNFQELLSFQRNIAHAIEDSIPKIKHLSKEEKSAYQESYRTIQKMIGDLSISGQNIANEHLDDDKKTVTDIFERTMGTGHDGISRMSSEFVDNTIDFFQDIYQRPFASKKEFVASVAVLGWLTYYMQSGGDADGANQLLDAANTMNETVAAGEVPDVMSFDDIMGSLNDGGGLSETAAKIEDLDLSKLTEDDKKEFVRFIRDNGLDISDDQMRQLSNYVHNNYGILGAYKHFTIDNAVTGTTLSLLDLARVATEGLVETVGGTVNEAASFFKSASNGAIDAGDQTFKINVFQTTIGHIPMIAALALMALTSGPRNGIKRIFGFFDGFTNSTIATLKDRPLALPAAALTALFEPQTIILANEADKGGFAFPLLAGIAAAALWKRKANSTKELHEEITQNARTLTNHLNNDEAQFKLLDARPDIVRSLSQAALLQEQVKADLPDDVKEISYSKKRLVNKLSSNFKIAADNLEPTLTALRKFDLAMDISSRYMGEENKTYHNFIHSKIESFTQALKDVQNEKMSVKEFERHINKDLKKVMQAQAFLGGNAEIYNAVYKKAPSERMMDRFSLAGDVQYNIQARKESFKQNSLNIRALKEERNKIGKGHIDFPHIPPHQRNSLTQASYTLSNAIDKLDISAKIAWERTKQGWNPLWDKIARSARGVQSITREIPHKKKAGVALIGAGLALAGADTAGLGGEALQNIIPHAGYSLGVLGSTGMFLLINPIDDLVFAHLGLGGLGYGAGTTVYGANKFVARPAFNYAREQVESFMEKYGKTSQSLDIDPEEVEHIQIPVNYLGALSETCILCTICLKENEETECPQQINLAQLLVEEQTKEEHFEASTQ